MWVVEVPTKIAVSKKKDFHLNLNEYRNAHHQLLNNVKIAFTKMVMRKLRCLPIMQQVNLTYTHFSGSNTLSDTSNVCSVVDKFFSDALVEGGYITDDNYTVVRDVNYRHGGVDAGNSRVEITIEPIGEYVFPEPKEDEMQITLEQSEIKQALTDYVANQVNIKEGMKIVIDLVTSRGAEGFKATIDIVPDVAEVASKPKARTPKLESVKEAPLVAVSEPEPEAVVKEPVLVEEEQEEEVKPATSLFAGLNKPKNN